MVNGDTAGESQANDFDLDNTWLTTEEAARYLKVSAATVTRYRKAGMIPAFLIPGSNQWRFYREDIDAALTRANSRDYGSRETYANAAREDREATERALQR